MNKHQWIVIAVAILGTFIIYFGFEIKPKKIRILEKSRTESLELTNINLIIRQYQDSLDTGTQLYLRKLEESLVPNDSLNISIYQEISGIWYQQGAYPVAGYYAEKVADILNTEESWSISGTTYLLGAQKVKEEKEKVYCVSRAISSFENAISINSENLNHRINLALAYVEYPPKNNPMKGIQMLIQLNENNPDNPNILFQLGRLAFQTGQLERALQRLETAVELDPKMNRAYCLLYQIYQQTGDLDKAQYADKNCRQ